MNRYFKVKLEALSIAYDEMRFSLNQPHEFAQEPFRRSGDFSDDNHGYVALGPEHTAGDNALLIDDFVSLPDVEEITREEYLGAIPQVELP